MEVHRGQTVHRGSWYRGAVEGDSRSSPRSPAGEGAGEGAGGNVKGMDCRGAARTTGHTQGLGSLALGTPTPACTGQQRLPLRECRSLQTHHKTAGDHTDVPLAFCSHQTQRDLKGSVTAGQPEGGIRTHLRDLRVEVFPLHVIELTVATNNPEA